MNTHGEKLYQDLQNEMEELNAHFEERIQQQLQPRKYELEDAYDEKSKQLDRDYKKRVLELESEFEKKVMQRVNKIIGEKR